MEVIKDQPAPVTNGLPAVWDLVIMDMMERNRMGCERYGTPLQPYNGRNALIDAYQESLDKTVYLRQRIEEDRTPPITAVFLDLDGVLVDFVGGALRAHGKPASCLIPGKWHVEVGMGLSPEAFWAKCRGHRFWSTLDWTSDGKYVLNLVSRHLPVPLWLLTSHSDDDGACSGKYAWLCRELNCLRRRAILCPDKRAVSRPGALLIDDSDDNVEMWCAMGGEAILLPRFWNSRHEAAHYALEYLETRLTELAPRCRP